jgi:hypothetical protein
MTQETKVNPDLLKGLGRQQETMPSQRPTSLPAGPGSSGTIGVAKPTK